MHKRSHTFVAVDEAGRKLGAKTVKATTEGHVTAVMWAREQFGTELLWGIEDCRNMSGAPSAICSAPASRWCGCPPN